MFLCAPNNLCLYVPMCSYVLLSTCAYVLVCAPINVCSCAPQTLVVRTNVDAVKKEDGEHAEVGRPLCAPTNMCLSSVGSF